MKSPAPRTGSRGTGAFPVALLLLGAVLHSVDTPGALAQGKITFDGPPTQPPGTQYAVTYYSENGLVFVPLAPAHDFARNGGGDPRDPYNGSAFAQTAFTEALTFSSLSGVPFGLISVDLAEYSTVAPQARTVSFIGHKADGTTVTISFTTDGIIDGTGPLADFETFYFDSSFVGLTRVDVPGYGWSMDNLVYSIPEPPILSLLSLTTLALLRSRSRQPPGTASNP